MRQQTDELAGIGGSTTRACGSCTPPARCGRWRSANEHPARHHLHHGYWWIALVIGLAAALVVALLLIVLMLAVLEHRAVGRRPARGRDQGRRQHGEHPAARGHRAGARPDRRRGRRPGRLHERAHRRVRRAHEHHGISSALLTVLLARRRRRRARRRAARGRQRPARGSRPGSRRSRRARGRRVASTCARSRPRSRRSTRSSTSSSARCPASAARPRSSPRGGRNDALVDRRAIVLLVVILPVVVYLLNGVLGAAQEHRPERRADRDGGGRGLEGPRRRCRSCSRRRSRWRRRSPESPSYGGSLDVIIDDASRRQMIVHHRRRRRHDPRRRPDRPRARLLPRVDDPRSCADHRPASTRSSAASARSSRRARRSTRSCNDINGNLDAGVDLLEGLLVKKAGLADAVGLDRGPVSRAPPPPGLRNFPESADRSRRRASARSTRGARSRSPGSGARRRSPMANPAGAGAQERRGREPRRPLALPETSARTSPRSSPRSPVIGTDAPEQYERRDDIGAPRRRLPPQARNAPNEKSPRPASVEWTRFAPDAKEHVLQTPAAFEYERATSVEGAIAALQRLGSEARVIAGGHSLLPMMKLRLANPSTWSTSTTSPSSPTSARRTARSGSARSRGTSTC